MRKVKKGSALLNVLMITMILTMTAGIVTTAVVQTTKGNAYKKATDDLTYAAESGIQQAISNVDNLKYQSLKPGDKTNFNIDSQFVLQDIKVNVEIKKNLNNSTYDVKSVSTKTVDGKTRERTVKAVITKTFNGTFGTENLLKYTLCGNNVYMFSNGSANPEVSLVNGSNNVYTANKDGETNVSVPKENNKYITPVFDKIPYAGDKVVMKSQEDLENLVSSGKAKVESFIPIGVNSRPLKIYMINTNNLVYEYESNPVLNQVIIICSGNFTVIHKNDSIESGMNPSKPAQGANGVTSTGLPERDPLDSTKYKTPTVPNSRAQFSISYSSIIAKNVSLYLSEYHNTAPSYQGPQSPITMESDLDRINEIIRKYASNWASDNVVDGEESWSETEVSYE